VCVWKLRLQTPALASFEAGKGAGEVVEENVHYVGTLALHCSSWIWKSSFSSDRSSWGLASRIFS